MKTIQFAPQGVCSSMMLITVSDDDIIQEVKIIGGCPGNTLGLSRLAVGMSINEAVSRLSGIRCGFKPTSCPDQLAKARLSSSSNANVTMQK